MDIINENLQWEMDNHDRKLNENLFLTDCCILSVFSLSLHNLLTMHGHRNLKLNKLISVINQLEAQNLFHNKFYFMPLHVSSTCAHHQEVKIALHSLWYHHISCT